MSSGVEQPVPVVARDRPRTRRSRLASAALLVVLVALALLAAYGVVRLRAAAAVACDIGNGFFSLQSASLPLAAVDVAGAVALWAGFRRHGTLGGVAALIVSVVFLAVTSSLFLVWTMAPDGYPSPMSACRDNVPLWWPDLLPGGRAHL